MMMKAFFFSLCFASVAVQASDLDSVFSNRTGVESLKKSDASAASQSFIEALSNAPYDARVHLNLGLSFEMLQQSDKALQAYESAAKLATDPQVRFAANFNQGQLLQKAKKTDEALSFYEKALVDDPNSMETKVNIELLLQDKKGGGEGEGENKDKQDQKDKDKKDGDQDNKEGKDPKDDKEKDQGKDKEDKPKEYGKNKPQPQKFKSEDLTQGDVNKILGEIKQQEQKIRAEFNKKDAKEKAKDKDW